MLFARVSESKQCLVTFNELLLITYYTCHMPVHNSVVSNKCRLVRAQVLWLKFTPPAALQVFLKKLPTLTV